MPEDPGATRRGAWRSLVSVLGLVVAIATLSYALREPLGALGRGFVDRFGVVGLGLGSFLADGLHFPVPPQFYLATAIAAGGPTMLPVTAIVIGSVLGGLVAFTGARLAARGGWKAQRFAAVRRVGRLLERRGPAFVGVATVAPVPYWLLCVAAGLYRLPFSAYAIIGLCRIPKLLFFYALISLAWCS